MNDWEKAGHYIGLEEAQLRHWWDRAQTVFSAILKSCFFVVPPSPAATACTRCAAWEWHQPGNSAEHQLQPCSPLTSSSGRCNMFKYLLYGLCVPRAWPHILQQDRESTKAGDRGVNFASQWRADHCWSKYKLEMLCSVLLWEYLLLLHTVKTAAEDWQWQHYNDPGPRSVIAGFLVLMCTKKWEKQRGQESRDHLQVRVNLIEVKNLFLISQIPFSPCKY